MMKEIITEFAELIYAVEDKMDGGWRKEHPPVEIKADYNRVNSVPADDSIEKIASEIAVCTKCSLSETRTKTVAGEGVTNPVVMFIGEGPGEDEDRSGRPFVGKAGQYLDKWLKAIGLNRSEDCFIGNVIKCRPPGNRDPYPEEISVCRPYLNRQLKLVKPRIIVTLGRFASQVICESEEGIGRLRGHTYYYEGIPVIPTYHPSAVLRNPELRKPVWDDLKRVKQLFDSTEAGG